MVPCRLHRLYIFEHLEKTVDHCCTSLTYNQQLLHNNIMFVPPCSAVDTLLIVDCVKMDLLKLENIIQVS